VKLELDPAMRERFEGHMGELGPWMHDYSLADDLLTGYFKYEGLGELTFVNSQSPAADIERMRRAYDLRQREVWTTFVESLFDRVARRADRQAMHLLDIASATGQLSLRAVQAGFGRVTSSEIRESQIAQQRLLLECLADRTYAARITPVHDPVSADAPDYPQRYAAEAVDVACSFGLLYHLTNPYQHLANLFAITRRHAVIYTMTHFHPLAKNMWYLTVEDARWVTKATDSISWTPHFLEVERLCRAVGFRRVARCYPEVFRCRFPEMTEGYARATDFKLAACMAVHRLTGLSLGHLRNHDFRLFQPLNLNPNYVAYVCEK
jgi:SAM-dependent methyltransferase